MKKIILIFALMVSAVCTASAQFGSDSRYIGVGVGVGGDYGIPVSLYYEQAVHEHVGIGATIAFGGYHDNDSNSTCLLGVRANYHFLEHIKEGTNWDTYGGVILGYATYANDLVFGGQLGARYSFSDSWDVFGEVGYGFGFVTLGVNYSF